MDERQKRRKVILDKPQENPQGGYRESSKANRGKSARIGQNEGTKPEEGRFGKVYIPDREVITKEEKRGSDHKGAKIIAFIFLICALAAVTIGVIFYLIPKITDTGETQATMESVTPSQAVSEQSQTTADTSNEISSGFYQYEVVDNSIHITGYTGTEEEVTIPRTIEGLTVTQIGSSAFTGVEKMKVLYVPETVSQIGQSAFSNCTNLVSVTIAGDSYIGPQAFIGDSALMYVSLSSGITQIDSAAFMNCTALEYIDLPRMLESISQYCFQNCSNLNTVIVKDHVTKIEKGAFSYCSSLKGLDLPDSLTEIEDEALAECTGLRKIGFPAGELSVSEQVLTGLASVTWNVKANSPMNEYAQNHGIAAVEYRDESGIGLYEFVDGLWFYKEYGITNWDLFDIVEVKEDWYMIDHGVLNWGYSGLVEHAGDWYYVENGVLNWSYTGLALQTDGNWYYVENGVLNWSYTGLALQTDGNWYYVENGVLNWSYTGLVQHDSVWYYVNAGVVDLTYSGEVSYEGNTYYVTEGKYVP